jgi:hypothetical protein
MGKVSLGALDRERIPQAPPYGRGASHFSTMHLLAALPGKNSRSALKQFSRRALRCGAGDPEKSPMRAFGIRFPDH